MSEHTPGPWRWDAEDDLRAIEVPQREGVWKGDPVLIVGTSEYGYPTEADARLIAAAPDLLAALENALSYWERGPEPLHEIQGFEEHQAAEAAIAKAKGVREEVTR